MAMHTFRDKAKCLKVITDGDRNDFVAVTKFVLMVAVGWHGG